MFREKFDNLDNMPRKNWVRKVITFLVGSGLATVGFLWLHHDDVKRLQHYEAEYQREKEEAAAEYLRRRAIAKAKNEALQSPPEVASHLSPIQTTEPTTDTGVRAESHVERKNVELITAGRYKGMTVEAAKAAARQELANAKASARRRHEWQLRYNAVSQRWMENIDRELALGEALSVSVKDEKNAMLSALSLLSPEQLDYMRQELLKTKPASDVDAFFDAIANAEKKPPERLERDVKKILMSKEAYDAADREVEIERIAIQQEFVELERTKP